jgi:hypothetical protein
MSKYSFIATDYELPEVANSKKRYITVREAMELGIQPHSLIPWEKMNPDAEIMIIDNEDDLGELVIKKRLDYEKNVRWYTDKPFIYLLYFGYAEARAEQLLKYLKDNINEGQQLELWSIWLDDKQNIKPFVCDYNKLSLQHIDQAYNSHSSCLIVKR